MRRSTSVATIAASMPTAAIVLPERAVAGFERRLSPTMNAMMQSR